MLVVLVFYVLAWRQNRKTATSCNETTRVMSRHDKASAQLNCFVSSGIITGAGIIVAVLGTWKLAIENVSFSVLLTMLPGLFLGVLCFFLGAKSKSTYKFHFFASFKKIYTGFALFIFPFYIIAYSVDMPLISELIHRGSLLLFFVIPLLSVFFCFALGHSSKITITETKAGKSGLYKNAMFLMSVLIFIIPWIMDLFIRYPFHH